MIGRFMEDFIKRLVRCLATTKVLIFPRRILWKVISYAISCKNMVIINYNGADRIKVLDLIQQLRGERDMLLAYNEAYQLFMAVKKTEKIEGDIAEVGVYEGASAKLICEAKGNKSLFLFDTFESLPKVNEIDNLFYTGQFSALLDDVKKYLKNYPDVHFYKGLFPVTANPVKNRSYSFVHLDVDIYESTLNSLIFFYHRIVKGGVIISHDYLYAEGVRKAFDDFFIDKPESVIELAGSQCLIVKL